MPTRFIPISEDEQKFSRLVEKILKDRSFARAMQNNPAEALEEAGYELTPSQVRKLRTSGSELEAAAVSAGEQAAIPLVVRPVVTIITRGTRPVVSVVTKGTRPVVSVAVQTIIPVSAAPAQALRASEIAETPESERD